MITRDLDRALAAVGGAAGTWRPGPPGAGGRGYSYATTIAFLLARRAPSAWAGRPTMANRRAGRPWPGGRAIVSPGDTAAALSERLGGLAWVRSATVTGGGYLTISVTDDALGALAVRMAGAGPDCARSDALSGVSLTASRPASLTTAPTWETARDRLARHVRGRLAEAAGARVTWQDDAERPVGTGVAARPAAGHVAETIAFAGADAVTFALCRLPPGDARGVAARATAAHHVRNPAYAVRYAHAHASSALRQAAELGLDRGEAVRFQPHLLAHPSERALLYDLSWLPERVGGAARRGRPDVFARYLEGLAEAYLRCQHDCPAAPPGGRPSAVAAARLWLATAARTALGAGLGLLGVHAPDRL